MSQKRKQERKIRFTEKFLLRKAQKLENKMRSCSDDERYDFLDRAHNKISHLWNAARERRLNLDARNGDYDDWSPMDDGRNYYRYEACMSVGDYEGANNCWS